MTGHPEHGGYPVQRIQGHGLLRVDDVADSLLANPGPLC